MKADAETRKGDLEERRRKMKRIAALAPPLAGLLWAGIGFVVWWLWP